MQRGPTIYPSKRREPTSTTPESPPESTPHHTRDPTREHTTPHERAYQRAHQHHTREPTREHTSTIPVQPPPHTYLQASTSSALHHCSSITLNNTYYIPLIMKKAKATVSQGCHQRGADNMFARYWRACDLQQSVVLALCGTALMHTR